jgi:preprotein translocase subunit YajC
VSGQEITGIVLIAIYFIVLLATRWFFIARPNKRFTLAKIEMVRVELEIDHPVMTNGGGGASPLRLLDEAKRVALEPERPHGLATPLRGIHRTLAWNGSRDLVAWGLVHEAERLRTRYLEMPALSARLDRGVSQTGELTPAQRTYWSRRLTKTWEKGEIDSARATLSEFLEELYDARDTKFVNLATLQNKVTWMVLIGLVLLGVLVTEGYETVILAGVIGGLLSRLQRVLVRRDVPSDYGVSWALLFLTPVSAALSAWAGLFLLSALQQLEVVNLEKIFDASKLDLIKNPSDAVIGLAILFGVSERFLERIVKRTEAEIDASKPEGAGELAANPHEGA